MTLIRPFKGLRPATGKAGEVAAPPYDVMSYKEALVLAKDKPNSFLHISRPEIDLPEGTDPYSPQVYKKAKVNLKALVDKGILVRDDEACFFVYRLTGHGVSQSGLVVSASVDAYDQNYIRKHEFTRPDKEDDRVRQIDELSVQTGPVLLAYPSSKDIDAIIASESTGDSDSDVLDVDGVRHELWMISSAEKIAQLVALFDDLPALYIADGHHRSAAASRVQKLKMSRGAQFVAGPKSYDYFLAVAFPQDQMQILAYNRVVADLNSLSPNDFLEDLRKDFVVQPSDDPVVPKEKGVMGLYLDGHWHTLTLSATLRSDDPIETLDVSVLSNRVLGPVLGIHDLRKDKRIGFVGGIRGTRELMKRVDSKEMACAFSLFPTKIEELMAIADQGQVMPPKSTWFEPKLADGLVSHVLD
ncbi:MAG: DUF1015 family protein [Proteobacteria bacterium]|nr:DUF1015 family protein [Pseudomonadota bacterium]MDA1011649.1 DUF1015 family protein [Pseudomonadota bacterium]